MKILDLQDRLDDLNTQALSIRAKAEAEERDLTDEEAKKLDEIFAQFERTEKDIERIEILENNAIRLAEGRGRKTSAGDIDNSADEGDPADTQKSRRNRNVVIESVDSRPKSRGKWGFNGFGEFAQTVANAARQGGIADQRLIMNAAASTYGSEGVGKDGGFAVPPDFRQTIVEKVMGEDSLLSRTDNLPTSSNNITVPIDETTPWQTTGGIQAYWENEANTGTQSKPDLQSRTVRLNKLMALVPVTEELLEDAPALDAYLRRKAPEKIDFKINLALLQGTGVGQPLGILNAGCTVSVAKESGQTADTVVYANLVNMYSRMYAPCRSNAVWLIHQDIEPQLFTLEFPSSAGTFPAYLPPGGLSASPYAQLFGRPIIPTEACETLGDKGDLIFADLSRYMTATKGGGVRIDTSMHLWFDQDLMAFKFVFRVAGMPWWGAAMAPRDGSNTRSCFVTLDERA